ncbi:uncharacterized protein ACO6RY_18210 [Pungitius sinensis]
MPNVKPLHSVLEIDGKESDVVFFKALKNIEVNEELKFDYGVRRRSFRGEGLSLLWLDK